MSVFGFHGIAGFPRLIGKAVRGAHEVAGEFGFEDFDFRQPFAGCSADPAGHERARGKAVVFGQRRAVHLSSEESIGVERLFYGNAANEWGNFAGNLVESTEHDVFAGGLDGSALQNITQTRSREARRADRALAPLHAGNLRTVQAASVPGTFQSVDDRVSFEF